MNPPNPFTTYLREIVYGGSDGIVTTFAVVAGFTGAQSQNMTELPVLIVLLFGFANLFADGTSMALGNFLSSSAEKDVYEAEKRLERKQIQHHLENEKKESLEILQREGFTRQQAEQLISIYVTNENYWLSFMMNHELKLPNPEEERPHFTALATFFAFVIFGMIPLLPYVFYHRHESVFAFSVIATVLALLLLGLLRWQVTRLHWLRSIGETLFLGSSAAAVAYLIGVIFRI